MSNDHLGMDVGQANELKLAFRRYGYTGELVKRLCEKEVDVLGAALDLLRGDAIAVPTKRVLNLSDVPVLKKGHRDVIKHLKQGKKCLWSKIRLTIMNPRDLQYTRMNLPREAPRQRIREDSLNPRTMMPWYMQGQRPANVCMRDYLLANQHLIPRSWNDQVWLLFWGTVFHDGDTSYVPGIKMFPSGWKEWDHCVCTAPHHDLANYSYENSCVVFA